MPKTIILIPSRMSATRLPGKPLLKINNLSIISHVVRKALETKIGEVVVATEDQEILYEVEKNGGKAILTSNLHKTGTDRIYEVFKTQLKKERDRRFEERRAEVLAKRPEQEAANLSKMWNERCKGKASDSPFGAKTSTEKLVRPE